MPSSNGDRSPRLVNRTSRTSLVATLDHRSRRRVIVGIVVSWQLSAIHVLRRQTVERLVNQNDRLDQRAYLGSSHIHVRLLRMDQLYLIP